MSYIKNRHSQIFSQEDSCDFGQKNTQTVAVANTEQEVVQEKDCISITPSASGIEANDVSSLFEQFLEYEQESGSCSCQGSSYISPVQSPSGAKDGVLGQLMIVKEVLSQEAGNASSPSDGQTNNSSSFKLKTDDGLLRTVNGVHPKGSNIRMADSPKFAKFKRKRLTKEPPLRRCFSGTNTPRCRSPSKHCNPEEMRKREAKLIEALALSVPNKKTVKQIDGGKVEKGKTSKRKDDAEEHVPSRLLPFVPKRNKNKLTKKDNDAKPPVADPRLKEQECIESNNFTQIHDVNFVDEDIYESTNDDDDIIVDMTVDHDCLPQKIFANVTTSAEDSTKSEVVVEECKTTQETISKNVDNVVPPTTATDNNTKKTARKLPRNYRNERSNFEADISEDGGERKEFKKGHNRARSPRRRPIKRSLGCRDVVRSHSRSRSPSPSQLVMNARKKRRRYSECDSDEDISEKFTELSNPVPYDIEHERKLSFLIGSTTRGNFERRNIYVGGISTSTSKRGLDERFRRFGKIEKISLHFRDRGDNYAFIVYENPEDAKRAIEDGNDDLENYPRVELCYGDRRKFVGGSYVDFDGNNSYLEEKVGPDTNSRYNSSEGDFDKLLRMAMEGSRHKRRERTPEWT